MKKCLSIVLCLFLTACGFTPMYGSGRSTELKAELSLVEIVLIPDEAGVSLRNKLIDAFYQNGYPSAPTHILEVSGIKEQKIDLDTTIDSEATRKQIRLSTTMILKDKTTGAEVLQRDLTSLTSYNILGSQFTTRVSENDAREAALNDLARQIETQVGLYLKR